jgi:AsmA protein
MIGLIGGQGLKRWAIIAIIIAAITVIGLIALFSFVSANTFRPLLEAQLTKAVGRQVKIGNLRFAPFSGSLVADSLNIAGDPNYSNEPFITATRSRIGIEMKPLILERQLEVRSLEIDNPQIHLVRGANGSWNFSTIGRNAASNPGNAQKKSIFPSIVVALLTIRNGRAIVENFPVPGPARVYDNVNLTARDFSFVNRIPFTLSASLPANGTVSITGNAGPVNQQDAAMTAFDAQISIQHLDPVAAGFLDPAVGVSMLADIDSHASTDGQIVQSRGTIHMQGLRLGKTGSPAPQPVELTYDVTQNLQDKSGRLNSADISVGSVAIHVSGVYRLVPDNPWLDVNLSGQNVPIDDLQSLMIATGMKLPNGSVLKGGTLSLTLAATGPANNLVIAGPIALADTRLVGFDLGSKISGIAAMGGIKTGDTTVIQKLNLNVRASTAGLKVDKIDAVMPAVGEATGSGTISPNGALSFRLIVKVTTASGLGKVGVGLLTKLNGMAGSAAKNGAVKGVPMRVTGTANYPVITADVNGLMRKNASTLGGKLKRLFGGKK